jgi:hypothetical protein
MTTTVRTLILALLAASAEGDLVRPDSVDVPTPDGYTDPCSTDDEVRAQLQDSLSPDEELQGCLFELEDARALSDTGSVSHPYFLFYIEKEAPPISLREFSREREAVVEAWSQIRQGVDGIQGGLGVEIEVEDLGVFYDSETRVSYAYVQPADQGIGLGQPGVMQAVATSLFWVDGVVVYCDGYGDYRNPADLGEMIRVAGALAARVDETSQGE